MRAAADEDKAIRSLGVTLANFGQGGALDGVEKSISQLSKLSSVADDQIRPSFQRLFTATGDVATSTSALALALDVAAGTGRSVEEVSQALARGYAGQTTSLSRLGAGLDKAVLASGDMGQITEALAAKFTGQAATAAGSWAGQLDGITIAAGEAQEKVGVALLTAVEDTSAAFGGSGGLAEMVTKGGDSLATLAGGITVVTTAMGELDAKTGVLSTVWGAVWRAWETTPFGTAAEGLLALGEQAAAADTAVGLANQEMQAYSAAIAAYAPLLRDSAAPTGDFADDIDGVGAAADTAATKVITLADALDRLNGKNQSTLSARSDLAKQWAAIATMGDTTTVGKGKNQRDVQLAFDPATRNGSLDLSKASGQKAADWIVSTANDAEQLAQAFADQGKFGRAKRVLANNRGRLADQLGEWDIARPKAMADSVLSTPDWLDIRRGSPYKPGEVGPKVPPGQSGGTTTVYQFSGDIMVDSSAALQAAAAEARRLAQSAGDRYSGMAATGKGYQR